MKIVILVDVLWKLQIINPMTDSNSALTDWIVKRDHTEDNIQLLCWNCNSEKDIDFKNYDVIYLYLLYFYYENLTIIIIFLVWYFGEFLRNPYEKQFRYFWMTFSPLNFCAKFVVWYCEDFLKLLTRTTKTGHFNQWFFSIYGVAVWWGEAGRESLVVIRSSAKTN